MADCFVGSKNPVKVEAAEFAIGDMLEMPLFTVGLDVKSGVAEQPLTSQETRQGAINRVEACMALMREDYPDAWYVAIEGGEVCLVRLVVAELLCLSDRLLLGRCSRRDATRSVDQAKWEKRPPLDSCSDVFVRHTWH